MTVVIAHGQPKSGSTFLYSTAVEICRFVNGEDFHRFRTRVLGEDMPAFTQNITADFLLSIDDKIGPDRMFVVKTHAALEDDVAELLTRGRVRAFTSFRDPRDTALSVLNVGARDRAEGRQRWFATIETIEQLRRPIALDVAKVARWAAHPRVLAVPYYLTAVAQTACVGLLADHLGVSYPKSVLAARMEAQRRTLPEFNRGIPDRFVDDLTLDQLRFAAETWPDAIRLYDRMLEDSMAALGYRLVHARLVAERDARLRRRLAAA